MDAWRSNGTLGWKAGWSFGTILYKREIRLINLEKVVFLIPHYSNNWMARLFFRLVIPSRRPLDRT